MDREVSIELAYDELMVATRATQDECRELAAVIGRKLNAARGPTVLFVPLRGSSLLTTEGPAPYDPEADEALLATLRASIDGSKVEVHDVDASIPEPDIALRMAQRLAAYVLCLFAV